MTESINTQVQPTATSHRFQCRLISRLNSIITISSLGGIVDGFLFSNTFYLENFGILALFLAFLGALLFLSRRKDVLYQTGWSSLISWAYVLPILFVVFAMPKPWPLVALTIFSVLASKTFFQMVGIYHRHWFVGLEYILIVITAGFLHAGADYLNVFYALPMVALFMFILIPICMNSFNHMVQYISLSVICYSLFGWFYLHGGRLLYLDHGLYIMIYMYTLSELSVAVCASLSLKFGKINMRNRINTKIKLEGFIVAALVTLAAAWGWRRMLPERDELDWICAGLIAVVFSILGDWTLSIIRKDLGIKDQGVFIIGRGDILSRVSKVIFVFPAYYYFLQILPWLERHFS